MYPHSGFPLRNLISVLVLLCLTGCAATSLVKHIDRLVVADDADPRILVMPPDIKYYLLTAAGIPEPHADWTAEARTNFHQALHDYIQERKVKVRFISDPNELNEVEVSYQKLYSAVGTSILIHHFGAAKLPAKQGSFDWSLGPGIREIGEKYEADYALFSYYRDYQASGGRIAFAILAAAAGVNMSMGSEGGFASLVDLKTGEIVWFNRVAVGGGELRDEKYARQTVDTLFRNLPEA